LAFNNHTTPRLRTNLYTQSLLLSPQNVFTSTSRALNNTEQTNCSQNNNVETDTPNLPRYPYLQSYLRQ